MSGIKKQSFIHGAAVLSVSGIIVKIIGACFKIPIGAILKPEGMASFSIAYNIYALLFVLSTAGVPVAVSKMVSHACATGRGWEAKRIYRVGMALFMTLGAVGTAIMCFGAQAFAELMGSPMSAAAIRAISPSVFLVAFSAVARGYYQGFSDMYPTAISQVLEALGKLFLGFGAAWLLYANGFGSGMVAAGAVLGVSAGAFLSAVYLWITGKRGRVSSVAKPKLKIPKSRRSIAKEMIRLSVPITLGAAVISVANVIDSALVMNLLGKIGFAQQEAMWLYGAYSYACNLFNLPSAVVATVGISLIPAVSAAYAKRDAYELVKTSRLSFKLVMLFAAPAAAGLFALSQPVMNLLYGGSIEADAINMAGELLSILALAVPSLCAVTVTSSLHQACGNVRLPVVSMLCGAIVKLVSNCILVNISQINIKGAAISTILCYTVIAAINIVALKKLHISLGLKKLTVKLCVIGILTGVGAYATYIPFFGNNLGRIGAVIAVFVGITVCLIGTFGLKMMEEEELKLVFRSKKISKFLKIH